MRQICVDASPAWRARCPDRQRRIREIGIVECSNAHEDEMRPRLCLAEEWRSAHWTESPVHMVAAVRHAGIVVGFAAHGERGGAEAGVNGSAAGANILALPAPAHARDDRWLRACPPDCSAQTSTGNRHSSLRVKERKRAGRGSYVRKPRVGKWLGVRAAASRDAWRAQYLVSVC